MQKLFYLIFLTSCWMCINKTAYSQAPATIKHGPLGVFIFLGKEIPSGKSITSYKVERSEDMLNWKQIAEVKTPKGFDVFKAKVENSKTFFPSQPLPSKEKLNELYSRAISTGNTDSLKGMRLLFPIRIALGTMYYDTTAPKNITCRYRISSIKTTGDVLQSLVTDTISLPFQVNFDTITYQESSYSRNSVMVKWKSYGKNPAPLFMVYMFKNMAPNIATGTTARFSVNDTTYYVYTDTALKKDEIGKEMQFFVSPYDYYANVGNSSQVAVITQDNFNRGNFLRNHIAFMPKLSGVQVCWHFSDPVTVKNVEIYRSENGKSGFRKLTEVPVSDTSFLDQQIWPETTYFYYIQVVAKAGKRTKQSPVLMAKVPGIGFTDKIGTPALHQVVVSENRIKLIIETKDTTATHLRIYRGEKGALLALPNLIEINKSASLVYYDATLKPQDYKKVFYAVRNEKSDSGVSSLSEELPVSTQVDPTEAAYFCAFPSKSKVELYWDDVLKRNADYNSYTLLRQIGPANSKSPLMVIAENLTGDSFTDLNAQSSNTYTYVLQLVEKSGNANNKTYKVTVPASIEK